MIIIECLPFFFYNGYVCYVFLLFWLGGLIWRLVH